MIARDKGEGQSITWGWAVAYRDFDRETKVTYPIPLHLFVRWGRDLRFWLMRVGRPGYRERMEHALYLKGHRATEQSQRTYIEHLVESRNGAWSRGFVAACIDATWRDVLMFAEHHAEDHDEFGIAARKILEHAEREGMRS